MKPFLTIDEAQIDPVKAPESRDGYTLREAARAVVFDENNAIALLHVRSGNYYKLPGGGIEEEEEAEEALSRELQEEIGCTAEVLTGIGTVREYRFYWKMEQLSYCYIARQTGEKGTPAFTEKELAEGFEVVWAHDIDHAIELLESSTKTADPAELNITFMRLRDVAIAKKAKPYIAA